MSSRSCFFSSSVLFEGNDISIYTSYHPRRALAVFYAQLKQYLHGRMFHRQIFPERVFLPLCFSVWFKTCLYVKKYCTPYRPLQQHSCRREAVKQYHNHQEKERSKNRRRSVTTTHKCNNKTHQKPKESNKRVRWDPVLILSFTASYPNRSAWRLKSRRISFWFLAPSIILRHWVSEASLLIAPRRRI